MKYILEFLLGKMLEPVFFAYYHLIENFTAGKKIKKWLEYLIKAFCIIVSYVAFLLVIIGAFFVTTGTHPFVKYGTINLVVGGTILLTHIIIGFSAKANLSKQQKRKEDNLSYDSFDKTEPTIQLYYEDNDNEDDL